MWNNSAANKTGSLLDRKLGSPRPEDTQPDATATRASSTQAIGEPAKDNLATEGISRASQAVGSSEVPKLGQLIIVSGPSGAGKSTVVRRLLAECELPLQLSVSATTRKQRLGEVHGRDYDFVTHEQFQAMRAAGKFLECKEVFGRGDWYGTLAEPVDQGLAAGQWVILEIDVQGALSVMEKRPDALSFFIHPGSPQELETRLRRRGTDDETAILRRLEVAADEWRAIPHYRYEIVNQDVADSVQRICQILIQSIPGAKHA